MKNLGTVFLVVAFVSFMAVLGSVAQGAPAAPAPLPAAGTPAAQPPSLLAFHPPKNILLRLRVPNVYDFCHGGPVAPPAGKNPNWDAFKMDIDQKQCGGPFDNKPTQVSGTDGPVHFELGSGGFPPLGMHLGLNGLLYGTPAPHGRLFKPQPFEVCAVTLGGTSNCQRVVYQLGPAPAANGAKVALLAGGAAAVALGAGMAAKGVGSGGSCGTPPANIFNDCFSNPQSPNCPADIAAYNTWCKCEGYAGGFSAESGGCVQ